jgi:hypothetical protein
VLVAFQLFSANDRKINEYLTRMARAGRGFASSRPAEDQVFDYVGPGVDDGGHRHTG